MTSRLGEIAFRPLTRDDFPLLATWLDQPHVAPWWPVAHDPASLEAKYGPRIDGDGATEVFLIVLDAEPIGLIQRYRTANHLDWRHALKGTGVDVDRSAGIDYLLGAPELIG